MFVMLTCVCLVFCGWFSCPLCLVECWFLLCVVWILKSVCFNHHCTFPPFHVCCCCFLSASVLFPFCYWKKDSVPPLFQWAMVLVNVVLTVEEGSYWISHSRCEMNLTLVSWYTQMLQGFPLLLTFLKKKTTRKLHRKKIPEIQNHNGWINMLVQISWMITQFLI